MVTDVAKIEGKEDLKYVRLDNKYLKKIAYEAAIEIDTGFSERMTADLINVVLAVEFNPFHEYFEKLKFNPDRKCVAGTIELLSKTIISENEDFTETLFNWMVNSISNIYSPVGCQNDQCLTLRGSSGVGKSSWINNLCPPDLLTYKKVLNFFPVPNPNKDFLMFLNNSFIIELDGINQSESNYAKYASYLRQGDFDMRIPFKAEFNHFQRNANFIGSTNELYSGSGFANNYYFPSVKVERIDFELLETIDINQAWFEALNEYSWTV